MRNVMRRLCVWITLPFLISGCVTSPEMERLIRENERLKIENERLSEKSAEPGISARPAKSSPAPEPVVREAGYEYNITAGVSDRDTIIAELGRMPTAFVWESGVYTYDTVPVMYGMNYITPDGRIEFSFAVNRTSGKHIVWEMRFYQPEYYCLDNLTIGLTVDEVIAILGTPVRTVDGQPSDWKQDVLYLNMNGEDGSHYYNCSGKKIRVGFTRGLSSSVMIYGGSTKIKKK